MAYHLHCPAGAGGCNLGLGLGAFQEPEYGIRAGKRNGHLKKLVQWGERAGGDQLGAQGLQAFDPFGMDGDGDRLTATAIVLPARGALELNPDGSFVYSPERDFVGEISFIYEVSDGELTDTATVFITFEGLNDAPVAVDDSYEVDEDTGLAPRDGFSVRAA